MSSLGANYSADTTGTPPAPSAVDSNAASSTPTPSAPVDPSALNPHPTLIVLDTPYTTGDLAPDAKYPHVYITTLYVNGPQLSITIQYEFGTMGQDGWTPAPLVPTQALTLMGMELVPFFTTQGEGGSALWDQVEALMYKTIQDRNTRTAGSVVTL